MDLGHFPKCISSQAKWWVVVYLQPYDLLSLLPVTAAHTPHTLHTTCTHTAYTTHYVHTHHQHTCISHVRYLTLLQVLYEGARLKHGRPLRLKGDEFGNIFSHFAPIEWRVSPLLHRIIPTPTALVSASSHDS
jgi:hypothetical protein